MNDTLAIVIEAILMPIVAFVVGLFMVLMMRKLAARLQRRVGPPLLQPLYDIIKLYGKQTQISHGLIHDIGIIMAVGGYVAAEAPLPVPGMEGIELIKRIRASRPELPIMAISGGGRTGAEEYLGLAEEFGAQVKLAKPFDPDEMLAHIRRLAGETPHTG